MIFKKGQLFQNKINPNSIMLILKNVDDETVLCSYVFQGRILKPRHGFVYELPYAWELIT